ncbi:MAG TPA: c-type cytochrome biogenesis protein CcmI [Methylomirabilota bacterium]|nr:c-type cytochrome biogenesis protein CcmI [Methylomirabilota bacterium]
MILWLVAALLTGVVAALLVPPLIGRTGPGARGDTGLSVYRAQLAELERDRERGILGEPEAAALRTEIERRVLKLGAPQGETDAGWRARPGVAMAAALLLPAAALALYLALGDPGLPGQPRSADMPSQDASDPQAAEVAGLVAQLEHRMAERPADPVGWRLLGHAQAGLGRWSDSARSYARAVAAGGGDAETLAAWGETLIFAAGGMVSPPAAEVLRRALEADPREPRARYYQGLAKFQAGDTPGALALWRALAAEAPQDAPWAAFLTERIRLAEAMTAPPGPGAEDVAAAEDLAPEQREAAIRGMVQRLADRLEREPEDLEGWLRLAHSYGVLGQPDARRGALERAARLAPGRADIQLELAGAEAAGGDREGAVRRLESLLGSLPQSAPERSAAEAELNRLRDRE